MSSSNASEWLNSRNDNTNSNIALPVGRYNYHVHTGHYRAEFLFKFARSIPKTRIIRLSEYYLYI
jgi:hypothetical protein